MASSTLKRRAQNRRAAASRYSNRSSFGGSWGVPTNVLNRLFLQTVAVLDARQPVDEQLHYHLSRYAWPSDAELIEKVRSVPFYENGRAHQKRLVLERLETDLRAEVNVDFESAELSIEHIMPQTLNDEWITQLKAAGVEPATAFLQWGHTLGNLTLTAWNGKLSNKLFDRKQEILTDSELRLNDDLKDAEAWGPEQIKARADQLSARAASVWKATLSDVEHLESGSTGVAWTPPWAAIPIGRWTAYGDLAALGETSAMPVAQHVAGDQALVSAYRVLNSDGSISEGFEWHDPDDDRDLLEVLTNEGIEFDESAKASQSSASVQRSLSLYWRLAKGRDREPAIRPAGGQGRQTGE